MSCVALFISGCARQQQLFCDIPEQYLAMPAERIDAEITLLEKRIAAGPTGPQDTFLPEAYYNLALLYSHHNNVSPDYGKALKALRLYARNLPPGRKKYDVLYLENLLENLEGLGQIRREYAELQIQHQELEKNYAKLRQQLDELIQEHRATKETIEQLKMLDIKLEQKKRDIM